MVERNGLQLAVGDVVVAPDGSRHSVVMVSRIPGAWSTVVCDSGVRVSEPWYEARNSFYDVESEATDCSRCGRTPYWCRCFGGPALVSTYV